MDGVLVDVTESYRETIAQTVRHFTGRRIPRELIQDYKNQGGWNNDWALSQKIVLDISGNDVPYDDGRRSFQSYFFGRATTDGLILRERWLPRPGLLDRLADSDTQLAIFTGRLRDEAHFTLDSLRSRARLVDLIVGDDDVEDTKPAPEGLLAIAAAHPGADVTTSATRWTTRAARVPPECRSSASRADNPRHDDLACPASRTRAPSPSCTTSTKSKRSYDENCRQSHATPKRRRFTASSRSTAKASTTSPPAFGSSTTCWSCSPNTAASI